MIGLISGSGFNDADFFRHEKQETIDTPYGEPSSPVSFGKISGIAVVVLGRHGTGHTINPSRINYRANIFALKQIGVTHVLATSACGSLREEIQPGKLVFPDQFIDMTKHRNPTFFDREKVAHIPMAEPFCPRLRTALLESARELGMNCRETGTVVTVEGPRFSTKAESNLWRSMGADIINMTTVPECVLAREAGLCYQVVAMPTDYDCWHETREPVTVDLVIETMRQNAGKVKALLGKTLPKITHASCRCRSSIDAAFI